MYRHHGLGHKVVHAPCVEPWWYCCNMATPPLDLERQTGSLFCQWMSGNPEHDKVVVSLAFVSDDTKWRILVFSLSPNILYCLFFGLPLNPQKLDLHAAYLCVHWLGDSICGADLGGVHRKFFVHLHHDRRRRTQIGFGNVPCNVSFKLFLFHSKIGTSVAVDISPFLHSCPTSLILQQV